MIKKGYLQISFAWLFALIVGAVILFFAVYGTIKFINSEQTIQDAKTGKEIGVLLNPLETSFETGKTSLLTLPVETRFYTSCSSNGFFGEQLIRASQKSFNKWTETNINIAFPNKYIFSETPVEGRDFYVFSKPFNFPFKVADLIYLTSSKENYCFLNAPGEIEQELLALKQKNLQVNDCLTDSIKVCFNSRSGCEINVNYGGKYVEKDKTRVYFEGDALMFAGIFADKETYECQLKRLMQKVKHLSLLYRDKAEFVFQTTRCSSNTDLLKLSNAADNLESSSNLVNINYMVEEVNAKNEMSNCRLW